MRTLLVLTLVFTVWQGGGSWREEAVVDGDPVVRGVPKDGMEVLDFPPFVAPGEADFMEAGDLVIGVAAGRCRQGLSDLPALRQGDRQRHDRRHPDYRDLVTALQHGRRVCPKGRRRGAHVRFHRRAVARERGVLRSSDGVVVGPGAREGDTGRDGRQDTRDVPVFADDLETVAHPPSRHPRDVGASDGRSGSNSGLAAAGTTRTWSSGRAARPVSSKTRSARKPRS